MSKSDRIHIDLTAQQRDRIREATGQDVHGLQLGVRELEQRIVPTNPFEVVSFSFGVSH